MLIADSPIPLYHQLAQEIRERLLSGEWEVGQQLPSENEFAREYDVCRTTVRRALGELERQGLVVTRKGKGRQVARPKIEQDLLDFYSLAREFKNSSKQISSQVLRQRRLLAGRDIQEALRVPSDTEVVEITRLRFVNGEPVILESSFVLAKLCPGLETASDLQALYEVLEREYNLYFSRAEEFLQTRAADKDEAQLLEVDEGSPVFLVERISYLVSGQPAEFRCSIIRGDRFRYRVELPGRRPSRQFGKGEVQVGSR